MNAPTDKPQVLLVEDDDHLRITLRAALSGDHVVSTATDGQTAFQVARESQVDLVLLDLGLPDTDGLALIPMLRSVTPAPIIVISAREAEAQKVKALDAGADDYLTKPFGLPELRARIRSVLRRASSQRDADEAPTRYACGSLQVDILQRLVSIDGERIHLTPVEFRIMAALVRRGGKVITTRQLLREVWGPTHEEDGHYLRIYMRQLRTKLEADPAQPRYLINEPGVGYRLAQD